MRTESPNDPTSPIAFAKSALRLPTFDLQQMRSLLLRKVALIENELHRRGAEMPGPRDLPGNKPQVRGARPL